MTDPYSPAALAQLAYQAYGNSTNGKNYQGLAMPTWDQLGTPIQKAWTDAINAVLSYLDGPTAAD